MLPQWITRLTVVLVGALLALGVASGPAHAVTVERYATGISPGAAPWDVAGGPDGNVWFTEPGIDRVARMTTSAAVTEFASGITPGSAPTGITAGSDGNLWFTEPGIDRVARMTPFGGVTEFSAGITPGAEPSDITAGPDGNLWFTEPGTDHIGRITTSGAVTEFDLGPTADEGPDDIGPGPDGNVWFSESNVARVGRITPGGTISHFATGSVPSGLTTGPDGNVWLAQAGALRLARITPSGTVTQFTNFASGADPRRMAVGRDRNIWITDPGRHRLIRSLVSTPGFTSFTNVNFPEAIAPGPGGDLWFTEPDSNRVGRVRFEAPQLFSVFAVGLTKTTATLTALVDPQMEPTTYVFDLGHAADSYFFTTTPRSAGSSSSRATVAVSITGLRPGSTYHFRLRATNWSGSATGSDHTFATAPELDRDQDNVNRPEDCDDNNPRIHPGAYDVPQNGIDEDCKNGDADWPRLRSSISATFAGAVGYVKFKTLKVLKARKGSKIRITCNGPGCHLRKRDRTLKVRRNRGTLSLIKRVRRIQMFRGTRVTVRVTKPRTIGIVRRWRGLGPSTTECSLRPGASRPTGCHRA